MVIRLIPQYSLDHLILAVPGVVSLGGLRRGMAHGHGDVLYPVAAVQGPLAERPAPCPQLEADPELLLHTGLHPAEALLDVELVGIVQLHPGQALVP